jgi:Kef-type K+ transport system membrane component KefB
MAGAEPEVEQNLLLCTWYKSSLTLASEDPADLVMMSLLFQISFVMLVTLACGSIARRLGQSRVIGEIVGGILLGPSVFGRFAPAAAESVFPRSSMASFELLSTIGLILFLFLVGTEVNIEHFHLQRATAALSSLMSILLPFAIGALLAHPLRTRFAPHGIGDAPFTLFLGIAMSITAFPVLARILEERGIQGTKLGTTAILCAAVDDVVAWILLAIAVALTGMGDHSYSLTIRFIGLAAYLSVMVGLVRPAAAHLFQLRQSTDLSVGLLGVMVAFALSSAAATDALGVHPLFGAFLAGLCFPRIHSWRGVIRSRMEMLVSVLLLPLFFALTGLRTRLDLLKTPNMWLWTAIIIVAATFGKVGGATIASRWKGETWRDSLALGVLLNTRGLVELIVLNIGYSLGVFSPALFTMLVVMALVTTMCTTPALNWLGIQNDSLIKHPIGSKRAQSSMLDS